MALWGRPGLPVRRVLPVQPELLVQLAQTVRWDRPGRRALMVQLAQLVRPAQRELLEQLAPLAQLVRTARLVLPDRQARLVQPALLLRQYMHNTEIAVTMRLSTILKTIKQPL